MKAGGSKKRLGVIISVAAAVILLATGFYFLKKNSIFADVSSDAVSISSGDGLTLDFNSGKATDLKLNYEGNSTTLNFAKSGGLFINDVTNGNSYGPDNFTNLQTTKNASTIEQTAQAGTLGIANSIKSETNRLDLSATISKNDTIDRAVNACYGLPFDAQNWVWHDNVQLSRSITDTSKVYDYVLAPTPAGTTINLVDGQKHWIPSWNYNYNQDLNIYSLGAITDQSGKNGLAFSVPQNEPRTFYVQYDNKNKVFEICFDSGISDKTTNFVNKTDFIFSLFKVDDPSQGFRSALQKYDELYAGQFANTRPQINGSGFYYGSTFMKSKFGNPSDFAFGYDWMFGPNNTLMQSDNGDGVKTSVYTWPTGWDFTNINYKVDSSVSVSPQTDCPADPTDSTKVWNEPYSTLIDTMLIGILNGNITASKQQQGISPFNGNCNSSACTGNTVDPSPQTGSQVGCLYSNSSGSNPTYKKVTLDTIFNPERRGFKENEVLCNAVSGSSAALSKNNAPYDLNKGTMAYNTYINPSTNLATPAQSSPSLSTVCAGVKNWGQTYLDKTALALQPNQAVGYPGANCIGLDVFGGAGNLNFQSSQFSSVQVPLVYDKSNANKLAIYEPFSYFEYANSLKSKFGQDQCIISNGVGLAAGGTLSNFTNASQGEWEGKASATFNYKDSQGNIQTSAFNPSLQNPADELFTAERFYAVRSKMNQRPYTISVANYSLDTSTVESILELDSFYGFYTSLSQSDSQSGGGWYFQQTRPQQEMDFYKNIQQAVKTVSDAGWQSETDAKSNNDNIWVERFGPKDGKFYLTVRNASGTYGDGATQDAQISVDLSKITGGQSLVSVNDLTKCQNVSLSGSTLTFKIASRSTLILELAYGNTPASACLVLNKGYNSVDSDKELDAQSLTSMGLTLFGFNQTGDRNWNVANASKQGISSIKPSFGYYIYSPLTQIVLPSVKIAGSANSDSTVVRSGWNLLSNSSDQPKTLSDLVFSTLKTGQDNTCLSSQSSCFESKKLSELIDPSSNRAYHKYVLIKDGGATDASKAFEYITVNKDNLNTLTIPSHTTFWFYLYR
jgi:hypothetical protein